ncbi:MAG: hypothetical protein NT069_21775 [Planctomycetota bacterium]|nr:hypothetical protein [Planctomycetota bacterium]
MKTDKTGRIELGALTGIVSITANGPQGNAHTWNIGPDLHSYTQLLHGRIGEAITVPFLPQSGGELSPSEVSLLEVRGGTFSSNRFSAIKFRDGLLSLEGLPAGDYDLLLKTTGAQIRVRITEGERQGTYVIGPARTLETRRLAPLQIASIEKQADALVVRLSNVSKFARVHVFATRFNPEYAAYDNLSRVRAPEPYVFSPSAVQTIYVTGRNIGDEYSYILNRQHAPKLPGNMLERPSFLLNPWAVRDTQTGEQVATGGDDFRREGAPAPSAAERPNAMADAARVAGGNFSNLDFLAHTSAVLVNLLPDEQGVIKIPLDDLGPHQNIVVAAIDPLNTTVRTVALDEQEVLVIDQRLQNSLDPAQHFTQQKQISVVTPAQPFVLADIATSRFEAYDSLAKVFGLYKTLSNDPKLAEFAPLLTWPQMTPEERKAFYSKNASHELSFFLAKKDPEFFKTVIKPYLANKRDKTFLDHWLLEDDVSEWVQPWRFQQLNVVERILLSQRIAGERPATGRHVLELYRLLPPNPDRFLQLFDTAVKGTELSTGDELGVRAGLQELNKLAEAKGGAMGVPMFGRAPAPVAASSPAPGGMPGTMGGSAPAGMRRAAKAEAGEKAAAENRAKKPASRERQLARDGKSADKAKGDARFKESADEAPMDASGEVALFDDAIVDRESLRALYRQPEKTREWAENNYHHLTIDQQTAGLVTVNAFWRDYANHDPAQPFQSRNLAEASRNFPEMMLALAILDLPFTSPKHETKFDGAQMTLTPGAPLVVYHEEIRAAKVNDQTAKILVGQTYFKNGERHMQVDGEQVDKYVSEEFLIHTVYGCQVVVTNPNSSRQKLSVLLQIPQGAIPVLNGKPTKTVFMTLEPYHTQTLDYYFYFPIAGQFPHFPVQVARNEEVVAFAAPFTMNVVDKPTRIDTKSWDYISQFGTPEEVLAFLNANNVAALNLDRIAWRMHDAKFFETATKLLASRHVYNQTLWSYGVKHNAVGPIREFLQHTDNLVNECGCRLNSKLLSIDPVLRRQYEHLEYKPLVNARAHALGKRRQIVNDRFHSQYHRWLEQAAYDRELSNDDRTAATYYLLLQDRVEEAREMFAQVKPDALATRMQYDYCAAYLDFFNDEPKQARAIALKYADHPVDRWRNTFATIVAQLDEAEGKDAKAIDPLDRNQQQGALAATEPTFEFQVEAKQIALNYSNLDQVRVNYYLMDVELLFSRNPIVQQFRGQFSAIKPNKSELVILRIGEGADAKPGSGAKQIAIPADLRNKNILVEVIGAGQTRTQAYYSHSLSVQVIENYGQVRVTQATTAKPVAKAYVKVYAQLANGQVKFYKDGYTDLRGRFDYASLSTNDLDGAAKFSILILSDDHGAVVREATPPKR